MKIINLRDFYKPLYDHDTLCEVPDEVAELLIKYKRREEAYQRRKFRYKAHYSFDRRDGIENEILYAVPSAEDVFCRCVEEAQLLMALRSLTDKQLRRLYRHGVLKMSYAQIAKIENVSDVAVRRSIKKATLHLKKLLSF